MADSQQALVADGLHDGRAAAVEHILGPQFIARAAEELHVGQAILQPLGQDRVVDGVRVHKLESKRPQIFLDAIGSVVVNMTC